MALAGPVAGTRKRGPEGLPCGGDRVFSQETLDARLLQPVGSVQLLLTRWLEQPARGAGAHHLAGRGAMASGHRLERPEKPSSTRSKLHAHLKGPGL